jgi:hypothetical protein
LNCHRPYCLSSNNGKSAQGYRSIPYTDDPPCSPGARACPAAVTELPESPLRRGQRQRVLKRFLSTASCLSAAAPKVEHRLRTPSNRIPTRARGSCSTLLYPVPAQSSIRDADSPSIEPGRCQETLDVVFLGKTERQKERPQDSRLWLLMWDDFWLSGRLRNPLVSLPLEPEPLS